MRMPAVNAESILPGMPKAGSGRGCIGIFTSITAPSCNATEKTLPCIGTVLPLKAEETLEVRFGTAGRAAAGCRARRRHGSRSRVASSVSTRNASRPD